MTIRVGIVNNPLDPSTWDEHQTDDFHVLIAELFPSWPSSARIYDMEGFGDWRRAAALIDPSVLAARDVTPQDDAGIDRLGALRGPLLVTIPPADPLTAIIAVVAIAVGVAAAFLLMPKLPSAGRAPSPNNALAERTNQARPNARIPDIFGTVECTPDLLMVPYSVFENNIEVDVSYMGVGRGSFSITRVRDGDTSIASISGSSAAIYGPGTSPNSGDAPQLQIGQPITDLVQSVIKLNEVNGQTLQPTNLNSVQGEDSIRFVYPDTIETNDSDIDFTDYFSANDALSILQAAIDGNAGVATTTADARFTSAGEIEFDTLDPRTVFTVGQSVTVANGGYAGDDGLGGVLYVDVSGTYPITGLSASKASLGDPGGINSDWTRLGDFPDDRTEYRSATFSVPSDTAGINLNGNYTALAVGSQSIQLNNPQLVNTSWANLNALDDHATDYVSPNISRSSESWVGPYIIDLADSRQILCNLVGPNGLYLLTKKKGKQQAMAVSVVLEVTPINSNDSAIGPPELFPIDVRGSDTERTTVGTSLWATPSFSGRCSIRMRRTSPTPNDDDYGAIVDEVKWRDAYGLAPVAETEFGNVTTVHTRTVATPGALSLKNRKLNMRVTRKLPQRISGSEFGPEVASDSVADILSAMAVDPFIGRRDPSEIDFDSIYSTVAEVVDYFGSPLAGQFGYTFDDSDLSFEETAQTVAQAVFCEAYRQGRIMRLSFERATEDSSLIFNARNTMPGSQKRTVRFGRANDHDGVDLDYIDPEDGAQLKLSVPTNKQATSPQSLEIVGVRSDELAYWQIWRAWNKIKYQNIAIELEATQEAALVIPKDRVLIADRNRPGVLQGEIEAENGTTLRLSLPATLDPAQHWTIFLQHIDGTVEALSASQGVDSRHVQISAAPRMPLSIASENFARATYVIVPDDDVQTRAFLLTEREPQSNFTETVRAINYSFLYYQHDQLALWLSLSQQNLYDGSPYYNDGVASGGLSIVADADRPPFAILADGTGSIAFPGFAMPESYTKAVWLRAGSLDSNPIIISSTNATERFQFVGGALTAGHNGNQLSAPWPSDGGWHHAAVAYDAADGIAALHVDGVRLDQQAIGPRVPTAIGALGAYIGRTSDLRIWKRALTSREVRAVYLGSKRTSV
jgi:hypothetical protein